MDLGVFIAKIYSIQNTIKENFSKNTIFYKNTKISGILTQNP